jgi:hypothetical protein
MNTTQRAEIAKRVVKVGFIVASADGLSGSEKALLVDYATKRSGLTVEDVESIAAGAKGVESLSQDDINVLRQLNPGELAGVLREIVVTTSSADGHSAEEESAFKAIVQAISQKK